MDPSKKSGSEPVHENGLTITGRVEWACTYPYPLLGRLIPRGLLETLDLQLLLPSGCSGGPDVYTGPPGRKMWGVTQEVQQ